MDKKRINYLLEGLRALRLSDEERGELEALGLINDEVKAALEEANVLAESVRINDLSEKMNDLKKLEEEELDTEIIQRSARYNVLLRQANALKAIEDTNAKKSNLTSIQKRSWIGVAASVLILVGAVWWMGQPTAAERYFEEHFVPDDQPFTVRGPADDLKQKCYTHYDKWEWPEAIDCILELKKVDDDPRHDYYLGICYLGNKEWEKAEEVFQSCEINIDEVNTYLNEIKRYN